MPTPGNSLDLVATAYAVLCGGTTVSGPLQSIAGVGTSGQVLTSNGAAALPTFQPTAGSIITLTGDTGGALASGSFTFNANTNSGSSVFFAGSGTTLSLKVTDSNSNTIVGSTSGNSSISGNQNACFGSTNFAIATSASSNCIFGFNSGNAITSGGSNLLIGSTVGSALVGGSGNLAIGNGSLGVSNGNNNTVLGGAAGNACNGNESNNILIRNSGVTSESNAIRIGTQGSGSGQQNTCFIAGIAGVTIASSAAVLVNTSTGQLGSIISSRRYKENIEDMADESSRILTLRPVTFNMKSDNEKTKHFGLIAEEVHEIMPELVTYNLEGLPETVHYHDLAVLLLNELIKLRVEVDSLKSSKG